MSNNKFSTIFLFDVDGTLTLPRQPISLEMWNFLKSLKNKVALGIVGGSDFPKILEQLNVNMDEALSTFDFIFSENGLYGYQFKQILPSESINEALGEEKLQNVINFCLNYMSNIQLPVKRGNFIELRKGMLNVSIIGRSCSKEERDDFVAYEKQNPVRKKFVEALQQKFFDYNLTFSIGGQISIDIFPKNWDKTYCLKYLTPLYKKIHFFGDKTALGGNDYEIYEHPATIGHTVNDPTDTQKIIKNTLLNNL